MKEYLLFLKELLTKSLIGYEENEKRVRRLEEKYEALSTIEKTLINGDFENAYKNRAEFEKSLVENGFDPQNIKELYLLISLKLASILNPSIKFTKEQTEALNNCVKLISARCEALLEVYVSKEDEIKPERIRNEQNNLLIERVNEWLNNYQTKTVLDDPVLIDFIKQDKNLSDKDRYDVLWSMLKFNENVYDNHKLMEKETFLELLENYGYDVLGIKNLDEYVNKITRKYGKEQLEEMLTYVDAKAELSFEPLVLLNILYYGVDMDAFDKTFNFVKNEGISFKVACETPSFWTLGHDNPSNTAVSKSREPLAGGKKLPKRKKVVGFVPINGEQVRKNAEFLKKIGLFRPDLKGINSTIVISPRRLERNYKACVLYGMDNICASSLFSNASSAMDWYVELGHYDYFKRFPGSVGEISGRLCLKIKYLKENNVPYYNENRGTFMGVVRKVDNLDGDYYHDALGITQPDIDNFEAINEFLKEHELVTIDKSLYDNPLVKRLETLRPQGEKGEYEYDFNGVIVSRKKVLRILNDLVDSSFDVKDILSYAAFYNGIFTKEETEAIKSKINEVIMMERKEVNNGVFI